MTMDTAGKAVLFTGVTVLISLSAVMLVPSPAFRSMSLGIMLAVIFVLAATLTLLPAVLAQARAEGRQARAAVGALRRAPLATVRRLGRAAVAPARRATASLALAILVGLAIPDHAAQDGDAVDQGRSDHAILARRLQPGAAGVRARARPGRCRSSSPPPRRRGGRAGRPARSRHRGADADADARRLCADHRDPQAGPVQSGGRRDDRPAARGAARRRTHRRRRRREPRSASRAVGQDTARDRRGARHSDSCCCCSPSRRR